MPVRNKAIAVLDTYEGVSAEATYVALVESIDWNRVLLEASGRHLALGHEDKTDFDVGDFVCGECLEAALLETQTYPHWFFNST